MEHHGRTSMTHRDQAHKRQPEALHYIILKIREGRIQTTNSNKTIQKQQRPVQKPSEPNKGINT